MKGIDQIEIFETEYDKIFDSIKNRKVVYTSEGANIYEDSDLVLQEHDGRYFKIKRNTGLPADLEQAKVEKEVFEKTIELMAEERLPITRAGGYNPLINTGK